MDKKHVHAREFIRFIYISSSMAVAYIQLQSVIQYTIDFEIEELNTKNEGINPITTITNNIKISTYLK